MNASIVDEKVQRPEFGIGSNWLSDLLRDIREVRVAVFGDLCLDAYWILDEEAKEVSLETGLPVRKVVSQCFSLGAAGNVARNVAALGAKCVKLIGYVGNDLFGWEFKRQVEACGVDGTHILSTDELGGTRVYIKPHQGGTELNRFDLGQGKPLGGEAAEALLASIDLAARTCDVAVINQQVPNGWSGEFATALERVIQRNPQVLFIIDSRDYGRQIRGAAVKANVHEAARMVGQEKPGEGVEYVLQLARRLESTIGKAVCITCGEAGIVIAAEGQLVEVPGIELPGEVDSVGAGDTVLAALAAAFAAEAKPLQAGTFANIAGAITSRQLRKTGAPTPEQIQEIGHSPDYIFLPRLASQPRLARHVKDTRIELVSGRLPSRRFSHAVLDHDGTVSVLRQGWEDIMEPMMIKAILGERVSDMDDKTYRIVGERVREFIDRTTGIQTLAQMKGLVSLVSEFGFVPASMILDEKGYKAIFNQDLIGMVKQRRRCIDRGELSCEDWQVKGARRFLERLRACGLQLLLASGTDVEDVIDEAKALGYLELFDGGIFGAVGDLRVEAKRDVLMRLMESVQAKPEEIMVIGDGPVEIREGRRRGAYTIGVASDEVRRFGMNLRKRTRLIRAGADIIISDYSQLNDLGEYLGLSPSCLAGDLAPSSEQRKI